MTHDTFHFCIFCLINLFMLLPFSKNSLEHKPDKSIFCCIYFIFSAAVPKSSHFGIFGILRHKLGLSGSKHKSRSQEHEAEDAYLPDQVLESPQVVRIKCEEGVDVESDMGSPLVIRRKVRA